MEYLGKGLWSKEVPSLHAIEPRRGPLEIRRYACDLLAAAQIDIVHKHEARAFPVCRHDSRAMEEGEVQSEKRSYEK